MLRGIKHFLWNVRAIFIAKLREYNDWLGNEHIAVTGGLLDKDRDVQAGQRYFDITLQVSEIALDRIIDHGSQLQVSTLSFASVKGRHLRERELLRGTERNHRHLELTTNIKVSNRRRKFHSLQQMSYSRISSRMRRWTKTRAVMEHKYHYVILCHSLTSIYIGHSL